MSIKCAAFFPSRTFLTFQRWWNDYLFLNTHKLYGHLKYTKGSACNMHISLFVFILKINLQYWTVVLQAVTIEGNQGKGTWDLSVFLFMLAGDSPMIWK